MKLQLLLKPPARNPEAKDTVRRICESLGMEVTGEGAATFSASMDDGRFAYLFGQAAAEESGSLTAAPLPIPEALSDFVASISVPPPHIYMRPKAM